MYNSFSFFFCDSLRTPRSVQAGVSVGGGIGLVAVCVISAVYIPSYIITTLKLRTGAIPTLTDDYFFNYRLAVDLITRIFGAMFWSLFATGIIISTFFAVLTGLFVWEVRGIIRACVMVFQTFVMSHISFRITSPFSYTGDPTGDALVAEPVVR
jgi:hypothetical protein